MDVEFVGQYHSFGQDISDLLITVHPYRDHSYYVCVAYYGDSSVFLYEMQFQNEFKVEQTEAKRRKHFDSTSKHYSYGNNYKLAFVKSHVLPFPIYFLLSAAGRTWAISRNAYVEITFSVVEVSCNTLVEFSLDQQMDVSSHESVESKEYKRNSVCHVSEFSNGILVCRENFLQKCWTLEVIRRGKKPILLFSVPFASSHINSCFYSSGPKGPKSCCLPMTGASSALKNAPVVSCIEMETEVNQGMRNVLKKDKFMSFFGCSVPSDVAVLIGFPDGNVLWQFMNLSSDAHNIGHEEREFHLLCNIEQPVCHINTVSHMGTGEISSIIVTGAYGKVMILSPEEVNGSSSFAVSISHIPSPVAEVAVCHQGLLHTSSDGQLWVSTFSDEKLISPNMLSDTHMVLNSQQLSYYRVKCIVVLNCQKGIIMCVGSDGSVHIGNFFRTKAVDQGITEEEAPFLLKSISVYGTQLQELQVLAQKQRRLFSAVAAAAKIKFQGDHEVSISCKVMEVLSDVKKFLIMIEFHNLNYFNLDHELWTLNGSVSSIQKERITLSQGTPLNHGNSHLIIEADTSLFADSAFPLLLEGGLLLDIPTEWKSLGCFENVVSNLPLYVKIQTIVVNEFCVLKQSDSLKWSEASMNQFEQCRYKSVFRALQKIGETKASCVYFKTGLAVKNYNYNLPQEFCFPIFASSAQSILNAGVGSPTESSDLAEKLIKYMVRKSNITVLMSTNNFVCLNNPVTISVRRNEDLIYVTLHCSSFPLLTGLKISLIHLLKEGNRIQSREKNISISSKLQRMLQALSIEISQLLCQQRNYIIQEDIEVYRKLRENVSNNLHIL